MIYSKLSGGTECRGKKQATHTMHVTSHVRNTDIMMVNDNYRLSPLNVSPDDT